MAKDAQTLSADQRRERIRRWLDDNSTQDLEAAVSEMTHVQRLVFAECADRLQAPLNHFLKREGERGDSFPEKSRLARHVNSLLALLHLGIITERSPSTAILVADDARGSGSDRSRFLLRVNDPNRGRWVVRTAVQLPELQLGPRV